MICKWVYIRGRAFNSWGVGRVGDFEKKIPASACRKKKNCMQHKCNRKKFLRCCKKEKKNVAKLFHHSERLYKIAAKLQPFSSLAAFELWIPRCCKIIASYVQCIISLSQAVSYMEVNLFIKESSFNRQWKLFFCIFNRNIFMELFSI